MEARVATRVEEPEQDASLPDPSPKSKAWAARLLVAAAAVAVVADLANLDKKAFDPSAVTDADLALFAGFFAAAAIIERIIEVLGPFVPWWDYPHKPLAKALANPTAAGAAAVMAEADDAAKQAAINQKKADRGYTILALATLLGALAAAASGLYLAQAIGMDLVRWADILVTAVAISGGTKGLHELIKTLQKAKGSGTAAG